MPRVWTNPFVVSPFASSNPHPSVSVDPREVFGGEHGFPLGRWGSKVRERRRIKLEKAKKNKALCVLGKYITIAKLQGLSSRAFVGWFEYI